jgi:hypothetical protein
METGRLDADGRPIDDWDWFHCGWQVAGNVIVGLISSPIGAPFSYPVGGVSAHLTDCDLYIVDGVPPGGSPIIVDIMWSPDWGATLTSIFGADPSKRPQIAPGQYEGSAVSMPTFEVANGLIQINVISVGSITPGSNLKVRITGRAIDG